MITQGTPEWHQLRMGFVTASRIKDVIAKTKSGYSTSRKNYRDELVKQRFGIPSENFSSTAMQHGTETEPVARSLYEIKHDLIVQEAPFIKHSTIEMAGMSPDGLVGDDGLIEIKCPNSSTHFDYLLDGIVPETYKPQMAWQMACSGRQWVDFISYDNRVPEDMQYFEIRYERDNDYIAMLESEVIEFLKEVDERFNELNKWRLNK
jgi:putative phage-type endonuclease